MRRALALGVALGLLGCSGELDPAQDAVVLDTTHQRAQMRSSTQVVTVPCGRSTCPQVVPVTSLVPETWRVHAHVRLRSGRSRVIVYEVSYECFAAVQRGDFVDPTTGCPRVGEQRL